MKHKNITKKILSSSLALAMTLGILSPTFDVSAASENAALPEKIVISEDDHIELSVSKENGGFHIDTKLGDNLLESDDNKFLLYPDEYYNSSYTSFRISKNGGEPLDYIFGREYGFLGLDSDMISVIQAGNTVQSVWTLGDLTFTQTLTVLNQDNTAHGMVNISYLVENSGTDSYEIDARILLDTALGYQDYAYYELPSGDAFDLEKYETVISEKIITNTDENFYQSAFFAYDDLANPKVRAYTLDGTVGDETITPYQVAFGHWDNLSRQTFDFSPNSELFFTNPYNVETMIADSAYALYYDMGTIGEGDDSTIVTNYGVYSNWDEELGQNDIVMNFTKTPEASYLETIDGENSTYLNNGKIYFSMTLQNNSANDYDNFDLVVKLQPGINFDTSNDTLTREKTFTVENVNSGGNTNFSLDLYTTASNAVTDYRTISIQAFKNGVPISKVEEIYALCPGYGTDGVVVNAISPPIVYFEGERDIFVSMTGAGAVKNTGDYTVFMTNTTTKQQVAVSDVSVYASDNTVRLRLDKEMDLGNWNFEFVFNDNTVDTIDSGGLTFEVTDDKSFMPNSYGLVTIERDVKDGTEYSIKTYDDESEYNETHPTNQQKNELVLLEFRGLFVEKETDANGNPTEIVGESEIMPDGTIENTMVISNVIDVENGILTITDADDAINIDMDADLYATGARTIIWSGVSAITTIEDGEAMLLNKYKSNGTPTTDVENSVANTNSITLLWPGAASALQTIGGVLMELRYGQFGLMATESGEVYDSTEMVRVLSFGAQLSTNILVPESIDLGDRESSAMEQQQREIVLDPENPYYTPRHLREIQDNTADAHQKHMNLQNASMGLYVDDVLFGGGFIGFNATIEIGIPSFIDGMPSVEGSMNLKIINKEWDFKISGSADVAAFAMNATLRFRSKDGIPVPDELYLYAETTPGISVDPFGVVWIKGAGGGFSDLYATIFPTSNIPPLTLMIEGKLGIFSTLTAGGKLAVSARSIAASLNDIGLDLGVAELNLIKEMGISFTWYPELRLYAGMKLSVFEVIEATGYIVAEEIQGGRGRMFVEGYAEGVVKIPDDIILVGGQELGQVGLGMNTNQVWGSASILKVDFGLKYGWGNGEVEFLFGKYNVPEPTYDYTSPTILSSTEGTLYLINAPISIAKLDSNGGASIFTIRTENDNNKAVDTLVSVTFLAENAEKAKEIADTISVSNGGSARTLVWDNTESFTNDDANATLTTKDKADGTVEATVILSFTETDDFGKTFSVSLGETDFTLETFEVEKLASLESATTDDDDKIIETGDSITINGDFDKIENISVFAKEKNTDGTDGIIYPLAEKTADTEGTAIGGGSVTLDYDILENMPTGSYTITVVATTVDKTSNPILTLDGEYSYTNANQPSDLTSVNISLGGDYTIDVAVSDASSSDSVVGYIATVYEVNNGELTPIEGFTDIDIQKDAVIDGEFVVGGSYTVPGQDTEGNQIFTNISLEAGKSYQVGVSAYNLVDEILITSDETMSSPLSMIAPAETSVSFSIDGAINVESNVMRSVAVYPTINSSYVSIKLSASNGTIQTGQYKIDDGEYQDYTSGDISLSGLSNGVHTLTFNGENSTGDNIQETFIFVVDTVAPTLLLQNADAFFNNDVNTNKLTLNGFSEQGATVKYKVEGVEKTPTTVTNSDGSFTLDIPLDTKKAYQYVEVWAEDLVGHSSPRVEIPMINAKLSTDNANFAIYLDNEDVTGKVLDDVSGTFSLKVKSANEVIDVNYESLVYVNNLSWVVMSKNGDISFDNGILTVPQTGDYAGVLTVVSAGQEVATTAIDSRAIVENDITSGSNNIPRPITYTIDIDVEGSGSISSGAISVSSGENKNFTFTPNNGYVLLDVIVDGKSFGPISSYEFENINSNHTLKVIFAREGSATDVFDDVSPSDWFVPYIEYVFENGIMTGTGDNTFSPQSTATRAQIWVVIARMAGIDTDGGSNWYSQAMEWAIKEGISDGTNPTGPITREQLVTMLYRFNGSPETKGVLEFSDTDKISTWAYDALAWSVENGIITGKGNNILDPKGNATRAELAAILTRLSEID